MRRSGVHLVGVVGAAEQRDERAAERARGGGARSSRRAVCRGGVRRRDGAGVGVVVAEVPERVGPDVDEIAREHRRRRATAAAVLVVSVARGVATSRSTSSSGSVTPACAIVVVAGAGVAGGGARARDGEVRPAGREVLEAVLVALTCSGYNARASVCGTPLLGAPRSRTRGRYLQWL